MDLFSPIVPTDRQHHNFKQALLRLGEGEFYVIRGWAEGFEDRDGKLGCYEQKRAEINFTTVVSLNVHPAQLTSTEPCHVSLSRCRQGQAKPPSIDLCSRLQHSYVLPFEARQLCSPQSHSGPIASSFGPGSVQP